MYPLDIVLHLAAAVMLFLWALRMVRTGVERAFGPALRDGLRRARGGAPGMALAGGLLAMVLQSGTAVGILAAGFAVSGTLSVEQGIAALVGADLGSALIARLLSLDLSALVPLLILLGATLFLKFEGRRARQAGRIILGIGFILMSLTLMSAATDPLRHSAALPEVVRWLEGDRLTALIAAGLFAWAVHSSVATVLLIAGFCGAGLMPLSVALPMVLGANAGGAMIAVWLSRGQPPVARRIPLANLLFRLAGVALAFPFLERAAGLWTAEPGLAAVNAHVGFNLLLALAALPLVRPMARLTERLLPEAAQDEPGRVTALDRKVLPRPGLALGAVRRELLHMAETIARMFGPVPDLLDGARLDDIARLRVLEGQVNAYHTGIKLYLAELRRAPLSPEEARLASDLMDFAIGFEHAGDLIAKTLYPLAETKQRKGLRFSPEGRGEIRSLQARVEANLQLALNVLLSADVESARALAREKEVLRGLVRDSNRRHMERLRQGSPDSIATSDIHIEVLRALKEINSLLVTVAYPILTQTGQLLPSRLVTGQPEE
ncbi:Na/Pi cotransporter family protein [Paenirhodobacter sp.]|uniref:Na/Pi cotransporter family protein n=1 Tax=Paenirhodobacter sp. TaxID=1965326 RepID=UPI003B3F80A2